LHITGQKVRELPTTPISSLASVIPMVVPNQKFSLASPPLDVDSKVLVLLPRV